MSAVRKAAVHLLGNFFKILSYPYHFLFPKKRFTIPAFTAARKKAAYAQKIPRTIWQTNFTDKVTLPIYLNYLFNRWISPTYEHHFISTPARGEFIKENYSPEIYEAYSSLQIGAAAADFWRVLVLQKKGGVYIDINATLIYPLDKILGPKDDEAFLMYKKGQGMSNFFMASVPSNPHLQTIINKITLNIKENKIKSVFTLTGPGVLNEELDLQKIKTVSYKKSCFKGAFTNERFQYVDKAEGKWTKAQHKMPIVNPK